MSVAGMGVKKFSALCVALFGIGLVGWSASAFAEAELRTWSDNSGKFKIKAKLVAVKGNTVTLEQEDGTEINIPLSKLSPADQKEAKKPVDDGDDPFGTSKKKKKSTTSLKAGGRNPGRLGRIPPSNFGSDESETVDSAEFDETLKKVKAPLAAVKPLKLPLPNGAKWKLTVPAPPKEAEFANNPKSVPLPTKEFFERIERLVVNPKAQMAVVGYINHHPSGGASRQGASRMVIANLRTGTADTCDPVPGKFRPLAISDDGKSLLMHKYGAGFGHNVVHSAEIWKMDGDKIVSRLSWVPFEGEWGGGEVNWGAFVGNEKIVLVSKGGNVGVWKKDGPQPLYFVTSAGSAVPALSPDGKLLAFTDGTRLDVLDFEKKKIVASAAMGMRLAWPSLAFSPTGKQICCIAHDQVIVGDVATGKLLGNMKTGHNSHGALVAVPADDHVLVGNEFLLNVPDNVETWKYAGADAVCCAGGWSFLAVNEMHKQGMLVAVKIPHPAIKDLLDRYSKDPSVFALHEGTVVKIDASGIPNVAERPRVVADLTAELEKNKLKVGENGTVTVVAKLSEPKQIEISFNNGGEYKFQEVQYTLQFIHNGVPIWSYSRSNRPFAVSQGLNQTFEMAVREHEKVDYGWYKKLTLPKYLQNLGDVTLPGKNQAGFGYGQSLISNLGMK